MPLLHPHTRTRTRLSVLPLVLAFLGLTGPSAPGVDIQQGEITGSLDSTLSLGVSFRTEGRDPDLIGRSNGGNANSINYDNGNLNYDEWDVTSAPIKLTSELELNLRNFGLFLRGSAFYDYAIMEGKPDRRDPITGERFRFSKSAERLSGAQVIPLDAYVTGDFDLGDDVFLTLKLGNQVVSWGESTFIQNGINTINPADLGALRVAGAELKEGLKPVPMVNADLLLSEKLSLKSFYQFSFRHTEIEPMGTFQSVNDFASPGGNIVFLGFGTPLVPDSPLVYGTSANFPVGVAVRRSADKDADDQGQFGLGISYIEPALNDTEFGLYWTHLHSRLPLLSAQAGTVEGAVGGDYAASATFFREFPEDIDTLGASFNTTLPASGVALQGEFSYRIDMPLQIDEVELLYAALSPLNPVFARNQLGPKTYGETIRGYKEKDVMQFQMTASQLLGPNLGADQVVLLGEAGLTYVPDLESPDELRYNGPGTYTGGDPFFTAAGIQPATQTDGFADDFSWGYRLLARAEYNNAIGAVSLLPQLAFSHDVDGTAPGPGGNFVEERMTVTASLTADYLDRFKAAVAYTNFFGADEFNQRNDRDFLALTTSYAF